MKKLSTTEQRPALSGADYKFLAALWNCARRAQADTEHDALRRLFEQGCISRGLDVHTVVQLFSILIDSP